MPKETYNEDNYMEIFINQNGPQPEMMTEDYNVWISLESTISSYCESSFEFSTAEIPCTLPGLTGQLKNMSHNYLYYKERLQILNI